MMKWNKLLILLIAVLCLSTFVGCGASGGKDSAEADAQSISGTLAEVKDFMFVLEADDGEAYAFAFEADSAPEGMDSVAEGDRVTVTYTGELSVVDAFEGTVLSVKKAA